MLADGTIPDDGLHRVLVLVLVLPSAWLVTGRGPERLELFGRVTCLCAAYPDHQFYDPAKEAAAGHVRVEGTVPNDRQWEPDRICVRTAWGSLFQIEQGEYHYPWWQSTPTKSRPNR